MQGEILLNKSMEELISFFLILNLPMKELRKSAAQKMKFSIKDIFSKCDQIRGKLWIQSHLLKKSLIENFIFCAVKVSLLDLSISLKNPIIFTDLHIKSIDCHQNFHCNFQHPDHIKKFIIVGQVLVLRIICSYENYFNKNQLDIKLWFLDTHNE